MIHFCLMDGGKRPTQAHDGDAGWDLYCNKRTIIHTRETVDVGTGLYVRLPPGYWGQIVGRSSAPKRGIDVVPAVIDNGFRGEMFVQMTNISHSLLTIEPGDRFAQLILHKIYPVKWEQSPDRESLGITTRGNNGFGSSGK